jgi:hypothetical protein
METSSKRHNIAISRGLALLGLFLGLGLVASAYLVSQTLTDIRNTSQTIRVKGYAEMQVTSDRASWQGRFVVRGTDLSPTYKALQTAQGKVLSWMKNQGVLSETLRFTPVSTVVRYVRDNQGYETSEIEGYVLEQGVLLNSTDIPLVSRVALESGSLISEGVEFMSNEPQFFFSGLEALKLELLGMATTNARERGKQLAESSGSKVGHLRSASQGVFQITPVDSTEIADYGRYDTSTVDKLVKAVVTMQYAITQP